MKSDLIRNVVLGSALTGCFCLEVGACAGDTSTDDDGAGSQGGGILPGAPVELLCEDEGAIVSGTTCGNGSQDPGEICYARTEALEVPYPYSVAHGDIDEDGVFDLVVTGPYKLYVYWGGAEGLLADATSYSIEVSRPIFAVADANGDGHLDIVGFADSAPTRTMALFGGGSRELTISESEVADEEPEYFFAAQDVDGDGFDDLATGGLGDAGPFLVTAFGAEGDAALAEARVTELSDVGAAVMHWRSAVGDVETGAGLDLLLLDGNNEVHLYSWTDDQLLLVSIDTEVNPNALVLTDADGDGANDVIMGRSGFLATARGDGTGTFGSAITTEFGRFMESLVLVPGRFGTEPLDRSLATVQIPFGDLTSSVISFAAFSDGAMRVQTCYGHEPEGVVAVDVLDLNGDGIDDLILAAESKLVIYESQP